APPPSLPSTAQLAARGTPSSNTGATPQFVVNPLPAPTDSSQASDAELASLLARYDKGNANDTHDRDNAHLKAQFQNLAKTGYPDDVRAFEQDMQRDAGMLAQLPEDVASTYRDWMNSNWDAFESTANAWLRSKYDGEAKTLREQIAAEYREAQ